MRNILMVVGCTGMLTYLSPQLAIVSVAVFPPVAGIGVWFGRRMKRQQNSVQKALAASSSVAEEVRRHANPPQKCPNPVFLYRRLQILKGTLNDTHHRRRDNRWISLIKRKTNVPPAGTMPASTPPKSRAMPVLWCATLPSVCVNGFGCLSSIHGCRLGTAYCRLEDITY